MYRSMIAVSVCGLIFGCGGSPGDGEVTQGGEAPQTQVESSTGAGGRVSELQVYKSSHAGAYVTFNPYGDHFIVQDTAADGLGVMVEISGIPGCWNHNGAGTSVDCNYNFTEGVTIRFRACVGKNNTPTSCAPTWTSANTAH